MKCLSMFSNSGIGDIGVENAGVEVVAAIELLKDRAETYNLNHPNTDVYNKDILCIDSEDIMNIKRKINGELDLIVCTPPCQGVSNVGKRDVYDIRNQLIKPAIKLIKEFYPKYIWIENVPGYIKATIPDTDDIVEDNDKYKRINILDYIDKKLKPLGYTMDHKIINAMDYGVPQSRKRVICILTRMNTKITFPKITYGPSKENKYKTVRDAIGHLPSLESGEKDINDIYHYSKVHNINHIKWIAATPEGCTAFDNERLEDRPHTIDKISGEYRSIRAFRTTYKRLYWDKPSTTITMNSGSISSQSNVHPRDNRAITLREAMLLQSMPMNYIFPKNLSDSKMREMVGEAVPSLLAEVITRTIFDNDLK